MGLISYHNDESVKKKYVNRMQAHINADELIRGIGWENGKGCAVGCTLNKYDHSQYEIEIGLPEWLAILEDKLFENVSLQYSKSFPLILLKAIPLGLEEADFNKIKAKFLIFILKANSKHVSELQIDEDLRKQVLNAIDQCLSVQEQAVVSGEIDESAAASAAASTASAAESAVASAAASAWSAAESAVASAAASAAASAWSVGSVGSVGSAWSVARSAESAAWSAARSAESAWSAARSAAYENYADYLIKIFREYKK